MGRLDILVGRLDNFGGSALDLLGQASKTGQNLRFLGSFMQKKMVGRLDILVGRLKD